MIEEIYIENTDDLIKILLDQKLDSKSGRYRSSFIYRGLSKTEFKLETSLKRNCKNKQKELEKCIIRNFIKYAETDQLLNNNSIWDQIMLGQHHGLPTRMLDWTYSPLVALHFACNSDDCKYMEETSCCIWKIDINEITSLLPKKYNEKLMDKNANVFTANMLNELATLDEYDSDMSDCSMVLIEPTSIDQRIINQYSIFSIVPMNMKSIEEFLEKCTQNTVKYIIVKDLKWQIRDMLDQMNINERIMYPGLDGLSSWLKRHYFVKN